VTLEMFLIHNYYVRWMNWNDLILLLLLVLGCNQRLIFDRQQPDNQLWPTDQSRCFGPSFLSLGQRKAFCYWWWQGWVLWLSIYRVQQ